MSLEMSYEAPAAQSSTVSVLSGSFAETEVYARLSEIFNAIFDDEIALSPQTTAQDVEGWDSFAQINLILVIESKFQVRFSSSDVERMHSVGDIAAHILRERQN